MRTLSEDLGFEQAAEEIAKKEVAILTFLTSRPELNLEANRNLIRDYLGSHPANQQNLERAVNALSNELARKSSERVQEEYIQAAAEELERQRQAIKNHNQRLLNASPLELRKIREQERNRR